MTVITVQLPGSPGSPGPKGDPGPVGPASTLTIGQVTTLGVGAPASATVTGTAPNQVLNLGIPLGPQGAPGAGATMQLGTVSTGAPGTSAIATLTGTAPNYTLNLTIPQGVAGPAGNTGPAGTPGAKGDPGPTGAPGPSTTLTIGTVTTGAAGSQATATVTGTSPNQVLNLTIPQGAPGIPGTAGGAGTGVPQGGFTGDVLTKLSGGDFDTGWKTLNLAILASASTIMQRDANGRSQVQDPAIGLDIANKEYVDGQIAPVNTAITNLTLPSAKITDAASVATPSVIMERDAAGRAQVVDPAVAADIATKNYVDTGDAAINTKLAAIPKIYVQTTAPTGTIAEGSLWFQG